MPLVWIRDEDEESAYQKSLANPTEKISFGHYTYFLNGIKCGFSPKDSCVYKLKPLNHGRVHDNIELGNIVYDLKRNIVRFFLNVGPLLTEEQKQNFTNWAVREMSSEEFLKEFLAKAFLIPKKNKIIELTEKLAEVIPEEEKNTLQKMLKSLK